MEGRSVRTVEGPPTSGSTPTLSEVVVVGMRAQDSLDSSTAPTGDWTLQGGYPDV